MESFVKYLLLLPVWVIGAQLYCYAVAQEGTRKQEGCQRLGILYITAGIVSLVLREAVYVVSGLVLIMLGLRLVSHGLDRINKDRFIDRYKVE